MQLTPEQMKAIGTTLRSVVASESQRYFKAEGNTAIRAFAVSDAIISAIVVALIDLGLSAEQMMGVDASDIILGMMRADGYDVSLLEMLSAVPASLSPMQSDRLN